MFAGKLRSCINMSLAFTLLTTLSVAVERAYATPINLVGTTQDLPFAIPYPEGFYLIDVGSYVERSAATYGAPKINVTGNLPTIVWSTPATFLGGRLETSISAPELGVGLNPGAVNGSSFWTRAMYNPAAFVGLAWDFGNGWAFGNHVGVIAPVDTYMGNNLGIGGNFWTLIEAPAIAYHANGYVLSANFFYAHSGNDRVTGLHTQPDTGTVDFAATKHINQWEVGLTGYASTDLTGALRNKDSFGGVHKQQQLALGGLVGYNFGPVNLQIWLTRDVAERNYSGYETRLWGRLTIPLWHPEPPAPPVIAKY